MTKDSSMVVEGRESPTAPNWPVATERSTTQRHLEHQSVGHAVADRAAAGPNAPALIAETETISYYDLNNRAGQIAQTLRGLGVGPNVVVGLRLPRSVAMVVGALGILKAGGAYLPLDPAYPATRSALQLTDAQVPVVITGKCTNEQMPAGPWRVVSLDPQGRQVDSRTHSFGAISPEIEVSKEDLAYVIYTSGSTGEPKGVEITHAGLQNLVLWHRQTFNVTPNDRAVLQASPGFDAAVWELWPYLTGGACVYIPDDDTRGNPKRFRDWLVEQAITVAFVPTPMAEQFMRLEWPSTTRLRILLTGADTLRHYPPATLPFAIVNNYGPTECTVVTTSGLVSAAGRSDRLPSIGRPISNMQVYILDENMDQLPPGEPGELYICGVGLARGYRNRPELTAQRFVANPFSTDLGSRLYRTEDVASYLPDGQIAFQGRIDDQVKIRGYRIELDEVASVLDRHPMVKGSVVVACEDRPGEKRLVAYVVPKLQTQLTAKALREFLLLHLPEYMVPESFLQLDALPLAPSGKVDRKALQASSYYCALTLTDDDYVAPRTLVEERITGMLASLLRLQRVGVKENFFLLGGNSLLGAQVIARVRDFFGVELSLLSLFNHPTVAELAVEIEQLLVAKLEAMNEDEALCLVTSPSNTNTL